MMTHHPSGRRHSGTRSRSGGGRRRRRHGRRSRDDTVVTSHEDRDRTVGSDSDNSSNTVRGMGIQSIQISYSPSQAGYATYRPGDQLSGTLTLVIGGSEPHKLSSVLVKVRGLAKTLWKTRSGSSKNRRTQTHSEELWLIREDIFFIRGPTIEALYPGTYHYPFTYQLRTGLPPSLQCQYGQISYLCKARAISSDFFAFNGKSEYGFTVLPHLDLSAQPRLAEPHNHYAEAETSWFGSEIGQYRITMNQQGFVGGQTIKFTLFGPDRLFEKMNKNFGVVKLKRRVLCIAHSREREEKADISSVQPGSGPSGWHEFTLAVPPHEGITISQQMCRIISVSHYIKVKSKHINIHLPVTIGTVPVVSQSPWHARSEPQRAAVGFGGSPARGREAWGRPGSAQSGASAPPQEPQPQPQPQPYDPPPSYDQVMQAEGGDFLSEAQRRRKHEKELESRGFSKLADI